MSYITSISNTLPGRMAEKKGTRPDSYYEPWGKGTTSSGKGGLSRSSFTGKLSVSICHKEQLTRRSQGGPLGRGCQAKVPSIRRK